MKCGDKVYMLNARIHETDPYFYPKFGTIGTVVDVGEDSVLVQWPKGTTADTGRWFCLIEYLLKAEDVQ